MTSKEWQTYSKNQQETMNKNMLNYDKLLEQLKQHIETSFKQDITLLQEENTDLKIRVKHLEKELSTIKKKQL